MLEARSHHSGFPLTILSTKDWRLAFFFFLISMGLAQKPRQTIESCLVRLLPGILSLETCTDRSYKTSSFYLVSGTLKQRNHGMAFFVFNTSLHFVTYTAHGIRVRDVHEKKKRHILSKKKQKNSDAF